MEDKTPANKLTFYRIKPEFIGHELSNKASLLNKVNEDVAIYCSNSVPRKPKYLKRFFKMSDEQSSQFFTASSQLVVLVRNLRNSEELALSFGSGRFLLDLDAIDDRFGLRTALNIVNSEEIKNFSKTVLESNPKSAKEQLAKTANINDFGISSEQDLIKGLTGRVEPEWATRLGKTVAGSESLTLRLSCDIDNITDVADHIVEAYESEEYKKDFDWVDHIKTVKNKTTVQKLNDLLIQNLLDSDKFNKTKVWAAVPDYLDYEEVYEFKIGATKQAKIYSDIEKRYIINAVRGTLNVAALKKLKVIAVSSANDAAVLDQWSAFRCLYAEVNDNDSVYLLIDGRWYEIANNFCEEVKKDYDQTMIRKNEYIDYSHDREADYNKDLAQSLNGICYDCKTVTYGSSHSKIEVCDVQTREGDLIHTKLYTGSAALSHLFNQGYVSGELVHNDHAFVLKAKEKIGGDFAKVPSNRKRKIIFAIITSKPDKFDMPFFSKVTLRSVKRQLRGLGYDIEVQLVKNLKASK